MWDTLQEDYGHTHPEVIQYLKETWIGPYKPKFVKHCTDKILHFGNTATSRGEGNHAVLKRNLGFSTGDLKEVVDSIELLLINERNNYLIAYDTAKQRLATELQIPIFRDVHAQVTPFVLRKILPQWKLLASKSTALP